MNVVALVDYIEVWVRCFQPAVIFAHAHARRRNTIARQRIALRIAAGVEAVRNTADALVVRRAAIGRCDPFTADASRGESLPTRIASDLLAPLAPTMTDRPGCRL